MNFNYKYWSELEQILKESPTVGIDGHSALGLLEDIATLKRQVNISKAALENIAMTAFLTTDGSGSRKEYEELYDFWYLKAADRQRTAKEALEQINKET